jgi:hypothetical protein
MQVSRRVSLGLPGHRSTFRVGSDLSVRRGVCITTPDHHRSLSNNGNLFKQWRLRSHNDSEEVSSQERLVEQFKPALKYSRKDAVLKMLEALQKNNEPTYDHGIEVLYRFAGRHLDPFAPSKYFGRPLDLGQFERFRRIMNTECFRILVNHTDYEFLSTLEVSDNRTVYRVRIGNTFTRSESIFKFTMVREFGGKFDGIWFCESLICDDDEDGRHIYGVI